MTPQPERERIEEIVQIFQHEYGQYTSLEALSIASDWLRNTLHQELQKAREEERERIKKFLSLRDASPRTDFDSDEEYQLHRQKNGAINWYANLIKGQIDLPDLPETNY